MLNVYTQVCMYVCLCVCVCVCVLACTFLTDNQYAKHKDNKTSKDNVGHQHDADDKHSQS